LGGERKRSFYLEACAATTNNSLSRRERAWVRGKIKRRSHNTFAAKKGRPLTLTLSP